MRETNQGVIMNLWDKWTKLCQANVDHYNNHPKEHAAIVAGIFVAGVVVFGLIARAGANERYPYGSNYNPKW